MILIGGLGTRLGPLTADAPKPLLQVGGRPFLEYLLLEAVRFGFRRILLLAGYRAELVERYLAESGIAARLGVRIEIVVEDAPAGTGGALWRARDRLEPWFFLLNGDSWFDFNWLSLVTTPGADDALATIALRRVQDASRYGPVETDGPLVRAFLERPKRPGPADINGGVYLVSREIVGHLADGCSLERDVFPRLATAGRLRARLADGRFVDIGVPEDFAAAQTKAPAWRRRPAAFLDRDGTLNEDPGYLHRIDEFRWLAGSVDAIRRLNDAGVYVFVVTNQAGVARGLYGEEAIAALHAWMQAQLRDRGAHIDDFRHCPFHPDGSVEAYRVDHEWRKPRPGMLLSLMQAWPLDVALSRMMGDKDIDVEAGLSAGVASVRLVPGALPGEVDRMLEDLARARSDDA